MKGVGLCSDSKQCTFCGAKLEMTRKNLDWVYDDTNTTVNRPTTVYSCLSCNVDFVIAGSHRDDSGWRPMHLPIRDFAKYPPRIRRYANLYTYHDPSIVRPDFPKKVVTASIRKDVERNAAASGQGTRDRTDPGIKRARTPRRSCEVCEFWNPTKKFCGIHFRSTQPDDSCKRFKRNFIKIYPGGGVSPR